MTDLRVDDDRWLVWPDWPLGLAQPADLRALAVAGLGGVAFDAGVRSGVVSLGGALSVVLAALGLWASGRFRTSASLACLAAAPVFGAFLAVRTSPWLVPLDVLAVLGLLALAAMLARDGALADLSVALLGSRAVLAVVHGVAAAGFLVAPVRSLVAGSEQSARRATIGRIARGALFAVPVVVLLGGLLASADAVFASLLHVDLSLSDSAVAHVVLVTMGVLGVGALLRLASARPSVPLPTPPWRLGTTEWTVVLGSLVVLFGVFAVTQVVTALGGARTVLETEGLTYAEYARRGYFQLLAVAALTGLVLAGLTAAADRSTAIARRRFLVLAELIVVLTSVLLLVALRRLGLYEDAYGWTMLRFVAKVGGMWLGVVVLLLAARIAGAGRARAWFVPAAVVAGLVLLVGLNVVNPEAAVVRHNLDRAAAGERFDANYLGTLSDDAMPTLVARLDKLTANERRAVLAGACASMGTRDGGLTWNGAASSAHDALTSACR